MVNQLQIFSNEEFGEIRTAGTWEHPLFCLADLCRVLELDSSAVMRRLEDGVITNHPILDKLGRLQNANFVNEDGLYDVILDSRKPEAKKFRKWITSEVLPAIRKTGEYSRQIKTSPLEQVKEVAELGKFLMAEFGTTKNESFLTAIELVEKYHLSNLAALKKIIISENGKPSEKSDVANLNATQVGELIGISPQLVNELLVRCGLQVRYGKEYRLTDKGKPFGREFPFYKNGHSGYRVLWKAIVTDAFTDGKFFIRRQKR